MAGDNIPEPTIDEQSVSRGMREEGKCGVIGYPLYDDGKRWRTWCTLPLGHFGDHGRRAVMNSWPA